MVPLAPVVVISLLVAKSGSSSENLEIDYSALASEAEHNKDQLLSFLNQTHVQQQYKALYGSLLWKLIGNLGSTRRIVSGRNTSIAAVPWQVSLREKSYPICGGSIVTHVWLLTAAHCLLRWKRAYQDSPTQWGTGYLIFMPEHTNDINIDIWRQDLDKMVSYLKRAKAVDLSVRLGSSWKTYGGEMYDVRASYVHPRYSSKTKVNDVGLVQLYSPLRFTARVLPIQVVARETRLRAGQPAIVSGWGKLKEGGPSATYLQSTTIKMIAMKLCKHSGLDRKAIDPSAMFCAGSFSQPSPDACQGDSGGPIVHEGVLIGVVSWGLGCARGNFPGVYTRLANPVVWDWVHDHLARKLDNTTLLAE